MICPLLKPAGPPKAGKTTNSMLGFGAGVFIQTGCPIPRVQSPQLLPRSHIHRNPNHVSSLGESPTSQEEGPSASTLQAYCSTHAHGGSCVIPFQWACRAGVGLSVLRVGVTPELCEMVALSRSLPLYTAYFSLLPFHNLHPPFLPPALVPGKMSKSRSKPLFANC